MSSLGAAGAAGRCGRDLQVQRSARLWPDRGGDESRVRWSRDGGGTGFEEVHNGGIEIYG